ncbi:MAG: protein kinase [Myxococcales bacterium]|nr:protein kinase [Myxococcales bacterium]
MSPTNALRVIESIVDDLDMSLNSELMDTKDTDGRFIGRYLVLSKLGSGAAGVSFAAYDPRRDCKVSLELIDDQEASRSSVWRRHLQEAQVLTQLDHPNILAVHELGVHEDQRFMATELSADRTMRRWLRGAGQPRTWREILAVFTAAGRGLAAARRQGLVHRCFGPDEVLVGKGGRVRVRAAGFTIARAELDREFRFNFCAALFEALHGRRPKPGDHGGELPRDSKVPAWLHAAVLRGLAPDPSERYGDLGELLAALEPPSPVADWCVKLSLATLATGALGLAIGLAMNLL